MKANFDLKKRWGVKITALFIFVLCLAIGVFLLCMPKAHAATYYNFAEALQKSIYFYDAEKCGPGSAKHLEWRGDCHRPPDRSIGSAGADDPALRDAEARRKKGTGHAVHRRRHGHRHVRGA